MFREKKPAVYIAGKEKSPETACLMRPLRGFNIGDKIGYATMIS